MRNMLDKGGCDEEKLLAQNLTSDDVNELKVENTFSDRDFCFYRNMRVQQRNCINSLFLSGIHNNFV